MPVRYNLGVLKGPQQQQAAPAHQRQSDWAAPSPAAQEPAAQPPVQQTSAWGAPARQPLAPQNNYRAAPQLQATGTLLLQCQN